VPCLQPGQFVGVGIEFEENKAERSIRVSSIIPLSPAAECGQIFVSDILMRVDDEETREWTLLTLADNVLGPPETTLKLTFLSPDSPAGVKDIFLTRRVPGELPRAARSPRGLEKVSFTA
jgi:C-terminal processing protease CtpA/Prc